MRQALTGVLTLILAVCCGTDLAAQQPLPITQVLLYRNGMAYIVRSGELKAPLNLTFHPEDMNDILKSFTAWNPQTNTLYSVGYTADIPSRRTLGRFPFDISGENAGLGGFLTQVKGGAVRLTLATSTIEGTLMAAQAADHVVSPQTTSRDYRLTVMLRSGVLRTEWLGDVRSLELVDPALRAQLAAYLEVLGTSRQDVTRDVTIYPRPAAGPVRVAYLQQFPLWKTSYRVDLGEKDGRVQGWAQIDNPTGESWNNVEVSLLSGSPVSFTMNLYEPLYTNRARVNVPGSDVAAPRQYESATRVVDGSRVVGEPPPPSPPNVAARAAAGTFRGAAGGLPGGVPGGVINAAGGGLGSGFGPPSIDREADVTEFRDAFEYRFPFPVQLASRQSALLPFLQKTMGVERLSIFNANADRGNPRLGAQLHNTTGVPFEPGPVTFFEDGRYAGEAVLDYLSRDEKRLVSYGVDHDVQIGSKLRGGPETTTRLTISKGIAVLFREAVLTSTYEIRNKGAQKTLIIEHPRVNGRTLKGVTPWETTDRFYRFRQVLTPGQSLELPVSEIISRRTDVRLNDLTREQVVMLSGANAPADVREKLGQIVALREKIAGLRDEIEAAEAASTKVFADQERLRENLKALRDTNEEQALRKRYLDQLTRQEEQIQTSRERVAEVTTQRTAAEAQLADLISKLSWEG